MDNPTDELDGKIFRKDTVKVITKTGKILHQGLYPEEKIIEAVNMALDIINNAELPVLLRNYFAYIHPFYNGNGGQSVLLPFAILLNIFIICLV